MNYHLISLKKYKMGVDNDCIFAYGFICKEFDKKKNWTWDTLEKSIDKINEEYGKEVIGFATDAYYNDLVFVYIIPKDNQGFHCGSRTYNSLKIKSSNDILFQVANNEIEALNKIRSEFLSFLANNETGWRPFSYSH